jgi:hypothetical protein
MLEAAMVAVGADPADAPAGRAQSEVAARDAPSPLWLGMGDAQLHAPPLSAPMAPLALCCDARGPPDLGDPRWSSGLSSSAGEPLGGPGGYGQRPPSFKGGDKPISIRYPQRSSLESGTARLAAVRPCGWRHL